MDEVMLRERWSNWARERFRQDPGAVQLATQAALNAIKSGQNANMAVEAAEAVVNKANASTNGNRTAAHPALDVVSTRLQWAQWAEREIVGGLADIRAATEAAVAVILKGGLPNEAIEAAREAVPEPVPGIIRGRVAHLNQRYERVAYDVLTVFTFVVQRFDRSGALLPPISVELRGDTFEGSLKDRDVVELEGHAPNSGLWKVKTVKNLTLMCDFGSAPSNQKKIGSPYRGRYLFSGLLALCIGLALTFISVRYHDPAIWVGLPLLIMGVVSLIKAGA